MTGGTGKVQRIASLRPSLCIIAIVLTSLYHDRRPNYHSSPSSKVIYLLCVCVYIYIYIYIYIYHISSGELLHCILQGYLCQIYVQFARLYGY